MKQRFSRALLLAVALVAIAGVVYAGVCYYWEPKIFVDGTPLYIWAAVPVDETRIVHLTVYAPEDSEVELDKASLDANGDGKKDFQVHFKDGADGLVCVEARRYAEGVAITFTADPPPSFPPWQSTACQNI